MATVKVLAPKECLECAIRVEKAAAASILQRALLLSRWIQCALDAKVAGDKSRLESNSRKKVICPTVDAFSNLLSKTNKTEIEN